MLAMGLSLSVQVSMPAVHGSRMKALALEFLRCIKIQPQLRGPSSHRQLFLKDFVECLKRPAVLTLGASLQYTVTH
jgi:hypothetical protein